MERASYFNVLKFFVLLFLGQQVSCQSEPELGIFAVSFDIVLSNSPTDDSVTTVALTTAALTTVAVATPPQLGSSAKFVDTTADHSSSTSSEMTSLAASSGSSPLLDEPILTTQPANVTDEISTELHNMLSGTFASTTAYQYTTKPMVTRNTGTILTYRYDVVYNKTKLNEASLLHKDSDFIKELHNVTVIISTSSENFTESFTVDEAQTEQTMTTTINTLNEQFAEESWLCTGSKCAVNVTTCRLNETSGTVVCVDKCQAFEAENQCTKEPSVFGVYLKGSCNLDSYGNPYCDCGMSPGDVMSNFYDGKQCVSVTFIVAMAASAGGLFFILWLITLCILVCNRGRSRGGGHSRKSSSSDCTTNYPGYHEAYHNSTDRSHQPPRKEYSSHGGQMSSHANNAYEVTVESDDEFKSARL